MVKTPDELELLRISGRLLASVFEMLDQQALVGMSTLQINAEVRKRVNQVLAEQFRRAREILQGQRGDLERLAAELYGKRALSADEVRDVVEAQSRIGAGARSSRSS